MEHLANATVAKGEDRPAKEVLAELRNKLMVLTMFVGEVAARTDLPMEIVEALQDAEDAIPQVQRLCSELAAAIGNPDVIIDTETTK